MTTRQNTVPAEWLMVEAIERLVAWLGQWKSPITLPRGWRRMRASAKASWASAQICANVADLNDRRISVDEFNARQLFTWRAVNVAGPKTDNLTCGSLRARVACSQAIL